MNCGQCPVCGCDNAKLRRIIRKILTGFDSPHCTAYDTLLSEEEIKMLGDELP